MGVGVFGSRIVLAGGRGVHPSRTYVFETDASVEPNPRFIRSGRKYVIPGLPGGPKIRPWLGEIDGKLYALSGRVCEQEGPTFKVFDRKTKAWASLPSLPVGNISWDSIRPSNVAVVGTKIFVTLRTRYETEGRLLFFDVADPKATWSDREPRIRDEMGVFHAMYNKVLVVDSEEEEDEKLIFTFDDEQIIVSRMVLSPEGETDCIERVAEISLPGALEGVEGTAYSCVHLGGQRVCFAFFWRETLHVLTFNYSYSKSAASPPLPSGDVNQFVDHSLSNRTS